MNFAERLGRRKEEARAGLELARSQNLSPPDALSFAKQHLSEVASFAKEARGKFRRCLLMATDGSGAAPAATERILGKREGGLELRVVESDTLANARAWAGEADLETTLWLGRAPDPRVRDAGVSFMASAANREGFLRAFDTRSEPGVFGWPLLLSAALLGHDVGELIAEAENIDSEAANRFAAIAAGLARGGADKLTLLPSDSLKPLSLWIARRIAASTGAVVPVHGEPQGKKDSYGHDRLFVSLALESEEHDMTFLAESGHTVVQWKLSSPSALLGEFLRWEIIGSALTTLLGPPVQPANEAPMPDEPALRAQGLAIFAAPDHAQILRRAAGTLGAQVAASPAAWIAAHLALADPGEFAALLSHDEGLRDELSPLQAAIRNTRKLACTTVRPGRDDGGIFIQLTIAVNASPERRALRIHSEGGDPRKLVDALHAAVKMLSK